MNGIDLLPSWIVIMGKLLSVRSLSKRNNNVVLILTTYGGDPDAAYRIARFLKHHYQKFILFVFGPCKSAGTLIALGADEIIMSTFGELGPLDIQLAKEDEFTSTASGLDYFHAMLMLKQHAFNFFEEYFLSLKMASGGIITTKTAAEIASTITIGLFSPITSQIDPFKLGEVQRAMKIAAEYGQRLSNNIDAIRKLGTEYPSHSFIIDYREAKEIFKNVREPDEWEQKLERYLFDYCRQVSRDCTILSICPMPKEKENGEERNRLNENKDRKAIKNNERDNTKDEQKPETDFTTEIPEPQIEKTEMLAP